MSEEKILTPEQQELISGLTEEDKKQIVAILTPKGKIDEEKLESVAGGLSKKAKAIIAGVVSGSLALTAIGLGAIIYNGRHPQKPDASDNNPADIPSADTQGAVLAYPTIDPIAYYYLHYNQPPPLPHYNPPTAFAEGPDPTAGLYSSD